ncbi:hypothetical protein KR009_004703 [Drosophila setifemur]|nr:hypothetical protein KR009_004703 [Drosophila setifemur]
MEISGSSAQSQRRDFANVPTFTVTSNGVVTTYASPENKKTALDFLAATLQGRVKTAGRTLLICQQNSEAQHLRLDLRERDVCAVLLDSEKPLTQQMVLLWGKGYIPEPLIVCDEVLHCLMGINIHFVVHVTLPPLATYEARLQMFKKFKMDVEMLVLTPANEPNPSPQDNSFFFEASESGSDKEKDQSVPYKEAKAVSPCVLDTNYCQDNTMMMAKCSLLKTGNRDFVFESLPEAKTYSAPEEIDIDIEMPPLVPIDYYRNHDRDSSDSSVELDVSFGSDDTKPSENEAHSPDSPATFFYHQYGVLAWSRLMQHPCYDLKGVSALDREIRDAMKAIHSPKSRGYGIQRYSWPHAAADQSLIVVGHEVTGKTWCYLPQLCHVVRRELLQRKEGDPGPSAIIVCTNQQEGMQIANWIRILFDCLNLSVPFLTMETLWDKSSIPSCAFQLEQPVGVLLTTGELLLQLKEFHRKTTPILKAASVRCIALDNFGDMCRVTPVVTRKMLNWLPYMYTFAPDMTQLFITGRVWTGEIMRQKVLPLIDNCLIVFEDAMEASVIGGIGWEMKAVGEFERTSCILGELRAFNPEHYRTVVICSSGSDVLNLRTELLKAGLKVAACFLPTGHKVVTEWRLKSESSVLLVYDDAVTKIRFGPVDRLIHYNCSSSWVRFKNRFSLFYDNYVKNRSPGQTVLLMRPSDLDYIWLMADFMLKHHLPRPTFWLEMLAEHRMQQDQKTMDEQLAALPICQQMLHYGNCYRRKCRFRHVIWMSEAVAPNDYPLEGRIRFNVLTCNSPINIAVRMHDKFPVVAHFLSTPMTELGRELQLHYEIEKNRVIHPNPQTGDLVVVQNMKRYERVLIVKADMSRKTFGVQLVDTGIEILNYSPHQLFICVSHFQNRTFEAMNLRLTGIEPDSMERLWSNDMRQAIRHQFFDRQQGRRVREFSADVDFTIGSIVFVRNVVDDEGRDLHDFILDNFHVYKEPNIKERMSRMVGECVRKPTYH